MKYRYELMILLSTQSFKTQESHSLDIQETFKGRKKAIIWTQEKDLENLSDLAHSHIMC